MASDDQSPNYFRPPPETYEIFADYEGDEAEDDDEEPNPHRPSHVAPKIPQSVQRGGPIHRMKNRPRTYARQSVFLRPITHRQQTTTTRREDIKRPAPSAGPSESLPQIPTLTQQGRLLPKAQSHRDDCDDGDEYAFPLPKQYKTSYAQVRTTTTSTQFSVFSTKDDKKKAKQIERLLQSEKTLRDFLAEFPNDTKVRGKIPQLEKYKQKLLGGDGLLNSAEIKWVYEAEKLVERRRVASEVKLFQEQTKAEEERASKKRTLDESQLGETSHPSTGGKTVPPGWRKRMKGKEIDGENSDEESDNGKHPSKGHKTLPAITTNNINFDVAKELEDDDKWQRRRRGESDESDGAKVESDDKDSDEECSDTSSDTD
ncbi:hypothetical protein BGW36DRAFT_354290 [Talaromyces proteolyticus]|uniref:Uncharacterized protein n=1 Tax=Talaromyces proteolyticus TaxID=1131652 RepID=A0AAD4L6A3_9EURO|nr:uncharacterized protein BGW36DRAFT_354290 [Talaromyces proteolyticus]KAH8705901.1 hypothetical protein BGW36DRAFT_354290 [Talaromyces proteolyticus]